MWKDIPGYPGYQANTKGQIKGRRGTILRPETNPKNGYLYVNLGGRLKSVHSAVALAFIGPRPKGWDVRHRNGKQFDNRAKNLMYGTRKQNMGDAIKHGTLHNTKKSHCKRGHEFDYITPTTGARQCTTCKQERKALRDE